MALSASSGVAISTKPKPRERPVSRSFITAADVTDPNLVNASRKRSDEVEKERPPTNSFTGIRSAPFLPPLVGQGVKSTRSGLGTIGRAYHHRSSTADGRPGENG
jgi:hypothetical protein